MDNIIGNVVRHHRRTQTAKRIAAIATRQSAEALDLFIARRQAAGEHRTNQLLQAATGYDENAASRLQSAALALLGDPYSSIRLQEWTDNNAAQTYLALFV